MSAAADYLNILYDCDKGYGVEPLVEPGARKETLWFATADEALEACRPCLEVVRRHAERYRKEQIDRALELLDSLGYTIADRASS